MTVKGALLSIWQDGNRRAGAICFERAPITNEDSVETEPENLSRAEIKDGERGAEFGNDEK